VQKSYRDFLGAPIRDRFTRGLVGQVSGFVINPANGEIVAFFAHRNHKLLLPTTDILRVATGVVWIENTEAFAAVDEIVRIHDIIKINIPIFGSKVFTVSRQYLGEVVNFQFETNGWVLTKLDVAKKILTISTERKLINSSQIVRIKPTEITVRDAVVRVRAKKANNAIAPDLANAAFAEPLKNTNQQ